METEYEIRFTDICVNELVDKLKSLDAKFIKEYHYKRYCYDFNPVLPHKWIRLRTDGEETTISIKEVNGDGIKSTRELELFVNDFNIANELLEELGYHHRSVQENKRIRYMLNGIEIDIDFWPHLKPFVELEIKNASQENLKEVVNKLGFDIKDCTYDDAEDMYFKKGYTKEDLNNLEFKEDNNEEF